MRVHWNVDITLLGWPGYRFWYAHLRYRIMYGREDYRFRSEWARNRHAKRVDEGGTFAIRPSFYGGVFIHYEEPPQKFD